MVQSAWPNATQLAVGAIGAFVFLIGLACVPSWGTGGGDDGRTSAPALSGRWRKDSTAACAERYPDEIEFRESTYLGTKGPAQRFIWWDAGNYRIADPERVQISTATDELVEYRFEIDGDVLTFQDSEGCAFAYRRIA